MVIILRISFPLNIIIFFVSGCYNFRSNSQFGVLKIRNSDPHPQKATSRKTNKDRDGKNHKENKIENNAKAKNKKTKNL